eukprot:464332-Rhodomonas_salina.1
MLLRDIRYWHRLSCYAVSGTDIGYAATRLLGGGSRRTAYCATQHICTDTCIQFCTLPVLVDDRPTRCPEGGPGFGDGRRWNSRLGPSGVATKGKR